MSGKEVARVLFFENFLLALSALRTNKMRTLLTMLGIIIGIGAVICIDTLGNSLTESIMGSMSEVGANNINVSLQYRRSETEVSESGAEFRGPERRRAITKDDKFTVAMIDEVKDELKDDILGIAYSADLGTAKYTRGSEYANVSVTGINNGYFDVNKEPKLISGSFIPERAYSEGRGVCMVSDYFCDNIYAGDTEKVLGTPLEVTIGTKYYTFTVVGVYKYEAQTFSMASKYDTETAIYVPVKNVFKQSHDSGLTYFQIARNTKSETSETQFTGKVKRILNKYYHNNPYFEPSTFSLSTMMEEFNKILNSVSIVLSAIAAISLLVGGIGVMNIMLVSISERTREIGTRKALGASNGSIRTQFIVEAVVLCVIGGILGIMCGFAMGNAGVAIMNKVSTSTEVTAVFSLKSIIIAVSFSLFIGVFFGYYPANKAAKMNPIDALRYE